LFNYLFVYLRNEYPQMMDRFDSRSHEYIIAEDARCVNQVMQVVAALT